MILEVKNLSISFSNYEVVKDLSFNVEKGETMALVGPNGAGKSVLFRALLNLIPYKGTINWQPNLKIGYVPQRLGVDQFFPLGTLEFLKFKQKDENKIYEILTQIGIGEKDQKKILQSRLGTLSGGEFQKILVAWATIDNPDVLLFDEPTAGIDLGGEETIYSLLNRMKKEHGFTILLISHDLHIVYHFADKVLCLNKKMFCYGEPSTALGSDVLTQLYGTEAKAFIHKHEEF